MKNKTLRESISELAWHYIENVTASDVHKSTYAVSRGYVYNTIFGSVYTHTRELIGNIHMVIDNYIREYEK